MSSRPIITIVAPSLSNNSMGRTRVIADLLSPEFEVEVFGYGDVKDLWAPLQREHWTPSGGFRFTTPIQMHRTVRDLARRIHGDLLYCIKPVPASFGLGLFLARKLSRSLILDIDDWEPGFLSRSAFWELRYLKARYFWNPVSPFYTRALDSLTHKATAVTVSNSFLQALYGGTWVPHARDVERIDRRLMGGPRSDVRHPTVLFAGSAKLHKGMRTLAAAWPLIQRPGVRLKLLGTMDEGTQELFGAMQRDDVVVTGVSTYEELLDELFTASVVVIPQENSPESVGQLPMKLLDAMAARSPIVASDVGDIPRWLAGGAGVCVTPGNAEALAQGIQWMLDNPERANACGETARKRVEALGSQSVVGARLRSLVWDVLNHRRPVIEPTFNGISRRP